MTEQVASVAPAIDIEKYVDKYVQIRDKKNALEEEHKKALAPFNAALEKISDVLMQFLSQNNVDNMKTGAGTASVLDKWTATVEDGAVFRDWLIANGQLDMADVKANVNNVRAYLTANGVLPPGVKLSNFRKIGVRRAGKSAE